MGKNDADKKLRDARRALDDNAEDEKRRGIRHETPKYRELNRRVAEAEKNASKRARFLR